MSIRANHCSLALIAALSIVACSSSTQPPTATDTVSASPGQVLSVSTNPIRNTSTVEALKIDSVLVENNVDANGKAAADHLEIALSNRGTTDLTGLEVYYTFVDSAAAVSESYHTKLPADFIVPAGGKRVVHFDNTGTADHFAVSDFSIYKTSLSQLDVTVIVSATNAALQTATVLKDAGGAETAD